MTPPEAISGGWNVSRGSRSRRRAASSVTRLPVPVLAPEQSPNNTTSLGSSGERSRAASRTSSIARIVDEVSKVQPTRRTTGRSKKCGSTIFASSRSAEQAGPDEPADQVGHGDAGTPRRPGQEITVIPSRPGAQAFLLLAVAMFDGNVPRWQDLKEHFMAELSVKVKPSILAKPNSDKFESAFSTAAAAGGDRRPR